MYFCGLGSNVCKAMYQSNLVIGWPNLAGSGLSAIALKWFYYDIGRFITMYNSSNCKVTDKIWDSCGISHKSTERTFQSSPNLCNGSGFTPTGIVYLPAVCCIRTVASEWQTLACLRLPLCAFDLWEKDFYRALCPFGEFSNSLTLSICYIASHWGDFYFCTSSSGVLDFVKRQRRWHCIGFRFCRLWLHIVVSYLLRLGEPPKM